MLLDVVDRLRVKRLEKEVGRIGTDGLKVCFFWTEGKEGTQF